MNRKLAEHWPTTIFDDRPSLTHSRFECSNHQLDDVNIKNKYNGCHRYSPSGVTTYTEPYTFKPASFLITAKNPD